MNTRNEQVEIVWIHRHAEIEGNERADRGKEGSVGPLIKPIAPLQTTEISVCKAHQTSS
jgi:hypothetical protein